MDVQSLKTAIATAMNNPNVTAANIQINGTILINTGQETHRYPIDDVDLGKASGSGNETTYANANAARFNAMLTDK